MICRWFILAILLSWWEVPLVPLGALAATDVKIEPTIVVDGYGEEELSQISIVDFKKEEAYLQNAASKGLLAEVKRALNRGASIDSVDDRYGYSALMWASGNGKLEVVQYLLRHGADPYIISHKGDKTALLWAVHNGHVDVVKTMLDKGVSTSHQNARGDTPILAAAYTGNMDILRLLKKYGASVHHTTGSDGYQAMHLAAFRGHQSVVSFLVDEHADIEVIDNSGKTPLMLAAMEGHEGIVADLIKLGADLNVQDMHGNSALFLAVHRNHSSTARLLLEHPDCMIHAFNRNNDHVLHEAIKNNNVNIVHDIVLYGMEYVTEPHFINAAIAMAEAGHHDDIVNFLRQFQS